MGKIESDAFEDQCLGVSLKKNVLFCFEIVAICVLDDIIVDSRSLMSIDIPIQTANIAHRFTC